MIVLEEKDGSFALNKIHSFAVLYIIPLDFPVFERGWDDGKG